MAIFEQIKEIRLKLHEPLYFKFVNQETVTVTVDLGFVWYEI